MKILPNEDMFCVCMCECNEMGPSFMLGNSRFCWEFPAHTSPITVYLRMLKECHIQRFRSITLGAERRLGILLRTTSHTPTPSRTQASRWRRGPGLCGVDIPCTPMMFSLFGVIDYKYHAPLFYPSSVPSPPEQTTV